MLPERDLRLDSPAPPAQQPAQAKILRDGLACNFRLKDGALICERCREPADSHSPDTCEVAAALKALDPIVATAQQPEGPDCVAFALSVRLSHANDARREAETERDALREKLAEAEAATRKARRTCPYCGFDGSAAGAETLHWPGNHNCPSALETDALLEGHRKLETWVAEAREDAANERAVKLSAWAERDTLREKLRTQENLAFNLQRFKDYVHQRLDEEGVPFDPEPEENAEHGCRIEGRLNYLAKEKAALREKLVEVSRKHMQFIDEHNEKLSRAREALDFAHECMLTTDIAAVDRHWVEQELSALSEPPSTPNQEKKP